MNHCIECGKFTNNKYTCNKCIKKEIDEDIDSICTYIEDLYPRFLYSDSCEDIKFSLRQYFNDCLMDKE